eukprot:182928-Amphidinium_carterae.1
MVKSSVVPPVQGALAALVVPWLAHIPARNARRWNLVLYLLNASKEERATELAESEMKFKT